MRATASIAGASGIIGSTLAITLAARGRAVPGLARLGRSAQWRADRLIP